MGDLEEQFGHDLQTMGLAKARLRFTWNVLRFFRPKIVKPIDENQKLNQTAMFKNYFKVSFRNIKRNRIFSFINIAGLAVGIASCLLIAIYVNHELSYDKYLTNYDRTYRVLHSFRSNEDAELEPTPAPEEFQVWGNGPVGPALINDMPEVEQFCRFKNTGSYLVEINGKRFQEDAIWLVDSTMFQIFDWPLLAGDSKTALNEPTNIVLTQKLAKKYFGDENPIGQFVTVGISKEQYKVSAVMADLPDNSHIKFEGLFPMSAWTPWDPDLFNWWGYVDFYTYFTLKPGTSISSLESKTDDFLKKYNPDWSGYDIAYEPLSAAYLDSVAQRQIGATGSMDNVYIFISIALFILLIACINFMNLSTARSVERAKEVGIRKAIGSQRKSIITQFLVESTVMSFIGGILAVAIAWFSLPFLEKIAGKEMVM